MNQAMFQSPRSGKFESNQRIEVAPIRIPDVNMFQSPRSGKFESNKDTEAVSTKMPFGFQSPRSGKFESNREIATSDDIDV